MENKDSVYLLKECDAGAKMAVTSINEVLDSVTAPEVENLLTESKSHHEKLCSEIHSQLLKHQSTEKDPAPMARGMSWLKTNMKLGIKESDATIADLITDGCNMGIKSLYKYKNQYPAADHASTDICDRLIGIEEKLRGELARYL